MIEPPDYPKICLLVCSTEHTIGDVIEQALEKVGRDEAICETAMIDKVRSSVLEEPHGWLVAAVCRQGPVFLHAIVIMVLGEVDHGTLLATRVKYHSLSIVFDRWPEEPLVFPMLKGHDNVRRQTSRTGSNLDRLVPF